MQSTSTVMSPVESLMVEKKEKLVPGVFVRSQKITPIKPNMVLKVTKFMDELIILPRPVMPTSQVCAKFEHLQSSILTLLDLKKVADKLEHELKVKRLQKAKESGAAGADNGEGTSLTGPGSAAGAAGTTTPTAVRVRAIYTSVHV
ncbi:hypothetical protein BC936DRAFT_148523 [Jimgerdemannia flammicorona]|uniref:DNA methyltransferase 1-associated 1 domain-containing protein n=1 Tax=Jimgerdemannia flammicorona TaxID=994334 RepID=A0A433D2U6_9FUNG|nr:hypothetical protein BC936DRAFT_148523 [Jimgerdemannia flammicorona]